MLSHSCLIWDCNSSTFLVLLCRILHFMMHQMFQLKGVSCRPVSPAPGLLYNEAILLSIVILKYARPSLKKASLMVPFQMYKLPVE